MKKTSLFLFLFSLTATYISAETIYGYVYDTQRNALPYSSVYLLSAPSLGTVSNNNGLFVLDTKGMKNSDTLVVSFVGFKTKYIPIKTLRKGEAIQVKLEDDMIMLSETTVFSKKIKNSRKRMREILKRTKEQMETDFPDNKNREYSIMSDYAIYNRDSVIVTLEKAFATIIEIPNGGKDGKDSIFIKLQESQTYTDPDIQRTIDDLQKNTAIKDNNKDKFLNTDRKSVPHKMLWGKDIKAFFDNYDDERIKRWEISHDSDSTSILSYREKKNYLGIIKYELKLNFIIDKYTYSIMRLSQELKVKAYIPFGYKLSEQELELLNVLALTGEKTDKFRVKKGNAHIIRDVKYQYKGREKHPIEKSGIFNMQFQNRKKVDYRWSAAAQIKILDNKP